MWLGYCAFHMGDYKRSMLEYEALTHSKEPPKVTKFYGQNQTKNFQIKVKQIIEITSRFGKIILQISQRK